VEGLAWDGLWRDGLWRDGLCRDGRRDGRAWGAAPRGSFSSEPGAVLAIRGKVTDHPARRDPGLRLGVAGFEPNAHAEWQNEPAFPCAMRAWSGVRARTMEK